MAGFFFLPTGRLVDVFLMVGFFAAIFVVFFLLLLASFFLAIIFKILGCAMPRKSRRSRRNRWKQARLKSIVRFGNSWFP